MEDNKCECVASEMPDKERFLKLLEDYAGKRNGMENLIAYLNNDTDFFTAPASTRFHGAYRGGLCKHSLNVFDCMIEVCKMVFGESSIPELIESITISALLHDLCKANFYKEDERNVKRDGVWVREPYYTIDEQFAYGGHGSKSVFLCERFITLTTNEAVAINNHMGYYDESKYVSNAYEQNTFAWCLHVADEYASYVVEKEQE